MRVISSNGNINVPYENNMFQLSETPNDEGCISVMTLRGIRSLGAYPIEQAREIFEEMIAYGNQEMKVYRLPEEVYP